MPEGPIFLSLRILTRVSLFSAYGLCSSHSSCLIASCVAFWTSFSFCQRIGQLHLQLPKLIRINIAIKFFWAYPRGDKPIPNSGWQLASRDWIPLSKWHRDAEFVWQIVKLSPAFDPSHEIRKRLEMVLLLSSSTSIVSLKWNSCILFCRTMTTSLRHLHLSPLCSCSSILLCSPGQSPRHHAVIAPRVSALLGRTYLKLLYRVRKANKIS